MKLISIYKEGSKFGVIIEEKTYYEVMTIDSNNKKIKSKKYMVSKYGNREHFASIYGKFNAYTKILKKEIVLNKLDYIELSKIYKDLNI
jgi:hypothetical protein